MDVKKDTILKKFEELFNMNMAKLASKKDIQDFRADLMAGNARLKNEVELLKVAVALMGGLSNWNWQPVNRISQYLD